MASAAGNDRGGWTLLGALLSLAAFKLACVDAPGKDEAVTEEVRAMLADVHPAVVAPALDRVASAVTTLAEATQAWDAAVQADPSDTAARARAQEAWRGAMQAWQEAELLQIGPAAPSLTAIGGADLRDRIYAWPTVNRCRVDQETLAGGWADPGYADASLVNVLGLAALEVTLFSPDATNACPGQVEMNVSGAWDALGEEGVTRARAAHARALAHVLAQDVTALLDAWSPSAGDFASSLAYAGDDGSPYPRAQDGVNAVFDALFYIETVVKDRKLGFVLGNGECTASSCAEQSESLLAGGSQAWIVANLAGFRALYTGGVGTGMDDLLRARGEAALADEVIAALDAADAAAAAIALPLHEAVDADRAGVETLHARVDTLGELLRADVAAVLALEVPQEAAGDND